MKKQIVLVAGLCLMVGLSTVPVMAQAGAIQVKVPFGFSFAEKNVPAGDYRFIQGDGRVSLADTHGKPLAIALANAASGRSAGDTGKVIFQCYVGHCFLSEVWSPAHSTGAQLLATRAEVEWAKKETNTYLALAGEK
jgi:hypothetical protein